jgi:hypothetical protein
MGVCRVVQQCIERDAAMTPSSPVCLLKSFTYCHIDAMSSLFVSSTIISFQEEEKRHALARLLAGVVDRKVNFLRLFLFQTFHT